MVCCCSLPPECCATCGNNSILGAVTFGPMPTTVFRPKRIEIKYTEQDARFFSWICKNIRKSKVCLYYNNAERGLECTAKSCPCSFYEADE